MLIYWVEKEHFKHSRQRKEHRGSMASQQGLCTQGSEEFGVVRAEGFGKVADEDLFVGCGQVVKSFACQCWRLAFTF